MARKSTAFDPESDGKSGTAYKLSLLGHIEKIVELSEKKGLSDDFFERAAQHITVVTEKLSVTPIQALLLSHFLNRCDDQAISIDDISESIKCSKIRIIQYMNELDELEKRKFICCCREFKSTSYRVPLYVITALRKDEKPEPEHYENISINEFFTAIENFFEQCSESELTFEALHSELNCLIENNAHLLFCQKLKNFHLGDNDEMLLLYFCHLFVNNDDDNIDCHDIGSIFEHKTVFRQIKRALENGTHELILQDFIENAHNDGFVDRESFKLTDKTKNDLLVELNINQQQNRNKKDLLLSNTILVKKMFYNEKEATKIKHLTDLLQKDNFAAVQKRLLESGLRTGFACLFSGLPGTGKTETVFQIARETGRDIMQVDISSVKSMWFGESEKQVKDIFDRYRVRVEATELAPILLFNEADAIIGRRKELSDGNRAVDQTENAMQNIILEEFEKLNGILIATSNLTKNMDKAFERRFLYKIEFEKPNKAIRQSIWQAMIPALSDNEAIQLAGRYNFSGGQIENISRKRIVDSVISGANPSFDILLSFCQDELIGTDTWAPMGFKR
ncbi:MAG: ATP-binding protein [Spirochaetaceae bacterium]|jgi:hypothetical protein|nr:ATP-binding protein [Spirochaetaceae bacterium]